MILAGPASADNVRFAALGATGRRGGYWSCSACGDQIPIARLGLAAVICASLWIAFVVMGERDENAKCSALLSSGNFKIAEGPIYDVWYGPKSQGFSVADFNFSYSYFVITGGFNGSLFENPIRQGEYARIYYASNVIIKMQIRQ